VTTLIGGRPVGAARRWGLNVLITLPAAAYLVAVLAPGPLPRPAPAVLAAVFAAAHAIPAVVCFVRGRNGCPEAWWALGGALLCRGVAAVWAAGPLAGADGRSAGRIEQAMTDGLVATAALLCVFGVVALVQPSGPRSRAGLDAALALSAVAAASVGLAPQARSLMGAFGGPHAGQQIAPSDESRGGVGDDRIGRGGAPYRRIDRLELYGRNPAQPDLAYRITSTGRSLLLVGRTDQAACGCHVRDRNHGFQNRKNPRIGKCGSAINDEDEVLRQLAASRHDLLEPACRRRDG